MLDKSTTLPLVSDLNPLFFPPNGPADRELEWLFTMAESDMGNRSNFIITANGYDNLTMEDRAEAAHAQRRIGRRLQNLGGFDAGVLAAAYAARNWPKRLREKLGRVTGVAVRLASAEVGLPDDDKAMEALELETALRLDGALGRQDGNAAVARVCQRGLVLLERAFRGYVRERGGAGAKLLQGVS